MHKYQFGNVSKKVEYYLVQWNNDIIKYSWENADTIEYVNYKYK